jgi:hypothetical protein
MMKGRTDKKKSRHVNYFTFVPDLNPPWLELGDSGPGPPSNPGDVQRTDQAARKGLRYRDETLEQTSRRVLWRMY